MTDTPHAPLLAAHGLAFARNEEPVFGPIDFAVDAGEALLVQGGKSLAQAMMILIPEAWSGNALMEPARRAFYEYHACLMEPWDGPAAVAFTDGTQIGAVLDRNGLRPARYTVTHDDLVVLASETGVIPFEIERIKERGRLQPGNAALAAATARRASSAVARA